MNPAPHLRLQLQRTGFALDITLPLPDTGITVLFGPSGCGKTTLLRCAAGLERAAGRVALAGQLWQDDTPASGPPVWLPTWQRPLGYVFQEASLFDHLDVRGNLQYALRRARPGAALASLDEVVALLGIGHLMHQRPAQLSGGERQRVAMARALAARPRILLLDEPLAALDHARRQDILPWLERLRDELRIPMLYVTHAADEVARLADHLVVLQAGRVAAHGSAAAVLAGIDTPVVLGDDAGALLHGQVQQLDTRWHLAQVAFAGGKLWLRDSGLRPGQPVRLRVLARDVSITLAEPAGTSIQNHLPCTVDSLQADAHPSQVLVRLRCQPPGATATPASAWPAAAPPAPDAPLLLARVTARAAHTLALHPGQAVWAQVKSVALAG